MAGEDRECESGVRCSWREARVGSGRAPWEMFRILDFIPVVMGAKEMGKWCALINALELSFWLLYNVKTAGKEQLGGYCNGSCERF